MKRPLALSAALVLLAAPVAAQESVRPDLVREILRRQPEWPGVQVEIPAEVYETYVRDLVAKPVPPQPPEVAWIHRATYRLVLVADPGAQEPRLEAEFDLVYLAGQGAAPLALLHNALAWADVTLDGKAVELRQADDGWFTLDPLEVGRHRLTAHAPLKPASEAGVLSAEWRTPPAAWTVAAVESDEAWEVRFSRCAVPIVGDEVAGTHGATGMLAGQEVRAEWCRPQPPVRRTARVEAESHVGWTIADGVHQVRAVLDLRLWGGEAEEFTLDLPAGVDRVEVTGPDVREVQTSGDRTKVFLRGAITQRTRLALAFEVPRPVTGRMTLPAFGVAGARGSGGTLGIAGGGGGVLLEMESPGLEATAVHDLPRETRGLLAAPPVLAYRLAPGPWEARVDLVALAEFPVRETLVDSALTTVLYRPDGRVMTKVIYEVRNRSQQYMRVDLPPGATLLVARVAEEQRSLARGPGSTLYVPLEKSVLTTAGLVSFPVELVYVMPGPPLGREGTFRLPLPRTDLSVAYARCALMLPEGMRVKEWQGALREVRSWSSETAELEFEYGRGYLAPPKPTETPKPKGPGILETIGGLFAMGEQSKYDAVLLRNRGESRHQSELQERMIQAKNRYRAGIEFYNRGDYAKARGLFERTIEMAPDSTEGYNAKKYLENVDVALGEADKKAGADRGARAAAKAVQRGQQMANVALRERQEELLAHGSLAAQAGRGEEAEAAYQVAVEMSKELKSRGEEGREQTAVVLEAVEFLGKKKAERGKQQARVAELEHRLAQAKESLAEVGGQEAADMADLLVESDGRAGGTLGYSYTPAPQPSAPAQVEMGRAIAEQQVSAAQPGAAPAGTITGVGGGGGGWGGEAPKEEQEAQLELRLKHLEEVQKKLTGAKVADKPVSVVLAKELDLERKVEERTEVLKGQARQAATLARQGRLAEAEQLMASLQKDVQTTASLAALAPARPAPAQVPDFSGAAPRFEDGHGPTGATEPVVDGMRTVRDLQRQEVKTNVRQLLAEAERQVRQARTPEERNAALQPIANAERIVEVNRPFLEHEADALWSDITSLRAEVGAVQAPGVQAAPQAKPVGEDLWERARGHQRQGDLEAAVAAVDEITRLEPGNENAERWRSDLRALQGQTESLARVPDVADKPETVGGRAKLGELHGEFYKAAEEIREQRKHQETVQFDVSDLAEGKEGAKRLASFIGLNYEWSLKANLPPGGAGKGEAVVLSDGNLEVLNDPAVVGQVQAVLDRLRANWGQRVAVGSRNVYVAGAKARSAGIEWVEGANSVRYAVVDEGALRNLVDLEQREGGAPAVLEHYQDAVVGTQALVANGAVVDLARAGDRGNTLDYNDNDVEVGHDDYLVVDNGSYVTAIKAGRMQHWSVEAEPVRFPGVPAVVVVPAVGYTVKFEKTLLEPEDSVELVGAYQWQGDER